MTTKIMICKSASRYCEVCKRRVKPNTSCLQIGENYTIVDGISNRAVKIHMRCLERFQRVVGEIVEQNRSKINNRRS